MNTIDKYCQNFSVDFTPVLNLCTDVVKTYNVTRGDVLDYEFPPVGYYDDWDISVCERISNETSYYELTSIPSETSIQSALDKCPAIGNSNILMKDKVFSKDDMDSLRHMHYLKNMKRRVSG